VSCDRSERGRTAHVQAFTFFLVAADPVLVAAAFLIGAFLAAALALVGAVVPVTA
jgi:hypothetical protein